MVQNQPIRKFIIRSLVIAGFCFFLAWILSQTFLKQLNFTGVYLLIPFIMLVTILLHSILIIASKNNPNKFINKFMASSGLKLMLYLVVIIIYVFFVKRDIILFICAFLSLYLMFTVLEISAIINHLKKN